MRLPSILCLLCTGCGAHVTGAELAPPASGHGWQLSIPDFTVERGTEVQSCHFFAVPSDMGDEVWVDHLALVQNPGSHHMNIFRVKTVVDLGGQPGDVVTGGPCLVSSNWSDWPLVINSQADRLVDWRLPDGVAMKFRAGERLMLQTHYVNATTQVTPTTGRVLANFYRAPATARSELGTIFATNQHIQICPGDTDRAFEARCTFPSSGITIVGANGHFHSRGVEFDISPVDAQGNVGSRFYQSQRWDEPPMARGLQVRVPPGGGIDYRCSFTCRPEQCGDPANRCCFTFGGKVETQEHCNAFVYYYPKTEDINCF